MSTLRILIADDHDLIRRGIKTVVESRKGWEVCGEAITGTRAVAKAQELKPDVAILDISMPELNGIEAAKRIRKASDTGRDLSKAIENLATHRPFYSSRVSDVIANRPCRDGASEARKNRTRVTSREGEIIQILSEGKSSKEAAVALNISVKTVETHRANIMRKLELHSVSELVRYAIRNQIIEA